jgi:hypothetical protein
VALPEVDGGVLAGHPVALAALVVGLLVLGEAGVGLGVDDLDGGLDLEGLELRLGLPADRDEDRPGQALLGEEARRALDLGVVALREDDPHRLAPRLVVDDLHERPRRGEHAGQAVAVGLEVGDRPPRDAALRRGLGHGRGDAQEDAGVEGLGDEVVPPEGEALDPVGAGDRVGDVLPGEIGEGAGGRELHGLVDPARPAVEGAPEDEREAEHVVDLVRVVGAAGGHDDVGPGGVGLLGQDLGHRVRHREHDRVAGHGLEHLARDQPRRSAADERVRALQGLGQRAEPRLAGEALLVGVHVLRAPLVDDPGAVDQQHVLGTDAVGDVEVRAGDRSRPRPREDDPHVLDPLVGQLQRVEEGGGGDDRGAVLVVVEDGDPEAGLELLLDVEALRGLDVLQVDAPEGGLEAGHALDELVGVGLGHLDVEDVDVGEALEEHPLALHDRLAGEGADVAEAEDGGAVRDHGHEVRLARVLVGQIGVLLDLEARLGDARRVREREVAGRRAGLARDDLQLPLAAGPVEVQGVLLADAQGLLLAACGPGRATPWAARGAFDYGRPAHIKALPSTPSIGFVETARERC